MQSVAWCQGRLAGPSVDTNLEHGTVEACPALGSTGVGSVLASKMKSGAHLALLPQAEGYFSPNFATWALRRGYRGDVKLSLPPSSIYLFFPR